MNVRELLEVNQYPLDNVSESILGLDFGDDVRVEKYGNHHWDLFDGVRLICSDCEAIINFEVDSEFLPLTLVYGDDDSFSEVGFDCNVCAVLLNVDGDVSTL